MHCSKRLLQALSGYSEGVSSPKTLMAALVAAFFCNLPYWSAQITPPHQPKSTYADPQTASHLTDASLHRSQGFQLSYLKEGDVNHSLT